MIGTGSLEFAHARIWARHGQRPEEALWRRIETTRDLATVLELARGTVLAAWVQGVGADTSLHAVEQAIRRQWRKCVDEVTSWMPPAWGPAIAWCAVLVDLPALQHLARGGSAPPWMADDTVLRGLADGSLPARAPLRRLLEGARAEPRQMLALWQAAFSSRLPDRAGREALATQLLPLLAAHAADFGSPQALDGWALRRQLRARLVVLLRRMVAEPAAAFVHLALSALEAERLRAELLRRAAFPQRGPVP